MKFLSNVLATLVGLFLFFMIMFFGLFLIGLIMGGSADDSRRTIVKDNSVLVLDLERVSQDYSDKVVITDFPLLNSENYGGFIDMLNAIEAAKTDKKIKGISMLNTSSSLGLAQAKALRDKLEEFKESGKFVVSYANYFTQAEYYINSVADTIYLNPVGEMDFKGLASEIMFFKDFQEKSGIKMEVIRHGKYKSAVEPFLENQMSPANREQMSELLHSAWSTIVSDISISRNIPVDSLNSIADNLGARTPEMALDRKLVDKIAYEDEYHAGIRYALGVEKNKEYNTIDLTDYANNVGISLRKKKAPNKIAVIYAQGEIREGEGSPRIIGEGYMKQSLQEAVKDKDVKVIVIRVDSPGGSALTSDIIWREIELTRQHKPVVVSMGNVAASGGYYISCNADYIFAEPTTITGSIGVLGAIPNLSKFVNNLGIYTDQVGTHKNSRGYSVFQPMDETFRKVTTESIEQVYVTFVNRVAKGRNMTFEQVDEIAQGRVWTGIDAKRLGLVDEIGGLDDAIAYAADLVDIDDYVVKNFPVFKRTFEEYFMDRTPFFMVKTKEQMIREEVGEENYQILQRIKDINSRKGIQAIMPYEIIIR